MKHSKLDIMDTPGLEPECPPTLPAVQVIPEVVVEEASKVVSTFTKSNEVVDSTEDLVEPGEGPSSNAKPRNSHKAVSRT